MKVQVLSIVTKKKLNGNLELTTAAEADSVTGELKDLLVVGVSPSQGVGVLLSVAAMFFLWLT